MLQVDLRELARGPVQTRAELAGDDPLFEGLEVVLADPVRVAGRLQSAGEWRFYWRGSLSTQVAGVCRRCLVPVARALAVARPAQGQAPRLKGTRSWRYRSAEPPSGRNAPAGRTTRPRPSPCNPAPAAAT